MQKFGGKEQGQSRKLKKNMKNPCLDSKGHSRITVLILLAAVQKEAILHNKL